MLAGLGARLPTEDAGLYPFVLQSALLQKSARGRVAPFYAHESLPDDCFVQTYLDGPEGPRRLVTQDITRYRAAVDWTVCIADQIARPIHIVPISAAEFTRKHRERLAQLDHQQRRALRQVALKITLEVLRDCDDPEVRGQVHGILTTLKVGQ